MSNQFQTTGWADLTTEPVKADFDKIVYDLAHRGQHIDGASYGRTNTGFIILVPGVLPGTQFAITNALWSGGLVTLTIGPHSFPVGQLIGVSGVTPTGYNVAFVNISGVTSTQISFVLAVNPGTWTSGGTVVAGGVPTATGMTAVDPNGVLWEYNGTVWVQSSAFGTVTHTIGALTAGKAVIGNGGGDIETLAGLTWLAVDGASGRPSLQNSWANYGSGWVPTAFILDPFGFVHVRGVISGGSLSASATIFTLPTGYRPTAIEVFAIVSIAGASLIVGVFVDTSGNVKVLNGWPSGTIVALNIKFSIT